MSSCELYAIFRLATFSEYQLTANPNSSQDTAALGISKTQYSRSRAKAQVLVSRLKFLKTCLRTCSKNLCQWISYSGKPSFSNNFSFFSFSRHMVDGFILNAAFMIYFIVYWFREKPLNIA